MTHVPVTQRIVISIAVAVTAALLSACSGGVGPQTPGAPAGQPDVAASGSSSTSEPVTSSEPSATATASADDFPTCDEVKAVLGSAVGGLIELEGSENGVSTGSDGPSLGCAWHTKETNGSNYHLEEYGGLSVGIFRDPDFTEESMESLGWTVTDPVVTAADAWALKPGGVYDPSDQLDVAGVQVVRDGIVVVFTSGGVALQDVPQLASLTNKWALGAGVSVLELMESYR